MANSTQQSNQEIERLQSVRPKENGSSSDNQSSDLNLKLLHHLVDVPRALQQKASNRDPEELTKMLIDRNAELIKELLVSPIKQQAVGEGTNATENGQPAWKSILVQKLIENNVNLADEKIKVLVDKKVDEMATKIDDQISEFVRNASSFGRFEEKLVFEIQVPVSKPVTIRYGTPDQVRKFNLHELKFTVMLHPNTMELNVDCFGIPFGMSCKVGLDVIVKNLAGQRDWFRSFNVVFTSSLSYFDVTDLIRDEEFMDESVGLVKDGKLTVEMVFRVEEPAKIKK